MTMPMSPNGKDARAIPLPAPASGAATSPRPPGAPPPLDLDAFDDAGLENIIEDAKAKLAARKAKREAEFFALIDEQARALNIPPSRLLATLRAKAAAAGASSAKPEDGRHFVRPKYRNPKNPAETWSGRGNAPKWYADALAGGTTEDALRVPEGEE